MGLWSKRLGALAQVGVVAGGTAIYSVCQWLILIIFARETSATELGKYAYALSVTAPFFIFAALSLRQVYVSDARRKEAWRDYLVLRVVTSAAALVLVCLFALASGTINGLYVIVAIVKAVDLVADIYLGPAQAAGRVRAVGIYQLVNGIASLVLFGAGIMLGWSPVHALAMSIAGSLIAGSYALLVGGAALRGEGADHRRWPRPGPVWKLALLAAPLGVAGFLNSVTQAAPRYVLERVSGIASVGVFSAMAYLLIAGNTVVSAVVQHELPHTVTIYQQHGRAAMHRRVARLTAMMAGLGVLALVAVWFWGEAVMTLLYGPGYGDRPTLLLLCLSWAVGAASWIWDMALIVQRAFVTQMVAAGAGAALSVLASLLVVGPFGLVGAGLVVLVASVAVAVVRIVGLLRLARRGARGHG